eukprot:11673168-Heterocapsa_arctica.AAC.1
MAEPPAGKQSQAVPAGRASIPAAEVPVESDTAGSERNAPLGETQTSGWSGFSDAAARSSSQANMVAKLPRMDAPWMRDTVTPTVDAMVDAAA